MNADLLPLARDLVNSLGETTRRERSKRHELIMAALRVAYRRGEKAAQAT